MESTENDKAVLISDIEADARAEAAAIVKEAEDRAAEKKKYAAKQIESLLNDARKKAEEQADLIKKKAASAADLEVKRRSMRARDTVMRDIMDRVEKKLAVIAADAERYRPILVNWIVEAGIGLGADSAEVNTSETERSMIDHQLLAEAGARISEQVRRQVTLTLSTAAPLKAQGVILTASDGRTAFNNQVRTRLLRNQRQIRTLIHDTLFADNRKE
jgi:vacuolar-type H+-ATPase subunit E/Vma4